MGEGRIIIERVTNPPRQGWAEDAKRLADAGDDTLTWPEFGKEEDETLKW